MKEPWEMIREEFVGLTETIDGKPIGGRYKGESDYNNLIASRPEKELKSIEQLIEQENPPISFVKGKVVWNPIYSPENEHRAFIKLALSEGKPVPSEVLKDYPDLAARVPHEPVKGEQAGMLGVPGKVVVQKRPWTPGQIEIESYTKYKEAMGKPRVTPVIPEKRTTMEERFTIDCSYCGSLATERTLNDALVTARRLAQRHNTPEEKITVYDRLAQRGTCQLYDIGGKCIAQKPFSPKAEAKVEAEAMKQAEKPSKNLYWYSIAELKKMCQTKGLSAEGSKESLIRRLK